MDRFVDVADIWNWLPAFRAVAEMQHLRKAADRLDKTPSALSKSIKQLEARLGRKLFARVGRRLEITPAGTQLLTSTRDAMRLVDDGMTAAKAGQWSGEFRIAVVEFLSPLFVRSLHDLSNLSTSIVPSSAPYRHDDVIAQLHQGEIDLAVTTDSRRHDQIDWQHLGRLELSVYCAKSHELFKATRIRSNRVLECPFVAVDRSGASPCGDGWPRHLRRQVGALVSDVRSTVDLAALGNYLCVLPDRFAAQDKIASSFRRLGAIQIAPLEIVVMQRKMLRREPTFESAIEALSKVVT